MTDQATTDNAGGVPERPTMLTVVIIIHWVLLGLALIVLLLAMGVAGAAGGGGFVMVVGIPLLLLVGQLLGTIQMWKMKKVGFYIYIGCWLISFILPIITVGFIFNWQTIVALIFPILYAINFKHLR